MATVGRLTRRPEFLRVADGRRKWVAPGLILQALDRQPPSVAADGGREARVGFTASAKVGNAVARNRARRRLKAAAAALLPLHGRPATDYVLIARIETLTRPFPALLQDLEAALRRLRCYVDDADAETAAARESS
jgi:ribonuclease P protein component